MTVFDTESVQTIAIFRALKLGDFLLFVPTLRAIRQAFPTARIDYIGLPWSEELAERFDGYIDNFVPFPGYPGLAEQEWHPREVVEFLQECQQQHYDLVFQLHGKGVFTNSMISLFGAKTVAGYAAQDAHWPNRDYFVQYPESQPEILRSKGVLATLGARLSDLTMEFPLTATDYDQLHDIEQFRAVKGQPYVCIHPGSITASPWPASNFAAIADSCHEQGLQIVLTGSEHETHLVDDVIRNMKAPAVNLAGKTTLGSLGALLNESKLVVANDTGVAHLAVAVDAPSVTIFTTTDPAVWGALDRSRHRVIAGADVESSQVARWAAVELIRTGENT